jgi:hypothetical protein
MGHSALRAGVRRASFRFLALSSAARRVCCSVFLRFSEVWAARALDRGGLGVLAWVLVRRLDVVVKVLTAHAAVPFCVESGSVVDTRGAARGQPGCFGERGISVSARYKSFIRICGSGRVGAYAIGGAADWGTECCCRPDGSVPATVASRVNAAALCPDSRGINKQVDRAREDR